MWGTDIGGISGKTLLMWLEDRRTQDHHRQKNTKELQASYKEGISEVITRTIGQLDEYFAGRRTTFDIPLLLVGTDFQKTVWNELLNIPYGKTISYAGLSQKLGNLKAIRAIASANGANPISILVPCHRVIGSDRKLVGYGGGLPAKKILLDLESSDRLF